MRIAVVLPAPFGPSTPYTPPAPTARSTPATAWVLPKLFFNPLVSIASFPMGSIPSLGVANGLVEHGARPAPRRVGVLRSVVETVADQDHRRARRRAVCSR